MLVVPVPYLLTEVARLQNFLYMPLKNGSTNDDAVASKTGSLGRLAFLLSCCVTTGTGGRRIGPACAVVEFPTRCT